MEDMGKGDRGRRSPMAVCGQEAFVVNSKWASYVGVHGIRHILLKVAVHEEAAGRRIGEGVHVHKRLPTAWLCLVELR